MQGPGHNTRTVLIPRKNTDYLVVSVGSGENIDEGAFQTSSGRAQIRSFNTKSLSVDGSAFSDEYVPFRPMIYGLGLTKNLSFSNTGKIMA